MWNSLELECPESDVVAYPPPDHYIQEKLRDFVTVLTTAADSLTSESPLWNEMKVLDNIQVKYKRILRCDRILIFLQRVGHCLRKMVLLNLSKSYLDLAERFLIGFQDLSGTPFLPSRQQVEYILIRTLSASRLVSEAITYSRETFCYLIQKLKIGHLILDLIMATSVIARVNILLRATLEQLSSIYKQVLFWRHRVKKGAFQWAEELDFPQDVEEWIKSFDPAFLKPLSMSKEDMDRVKLMLKQMNKTNNQIEVSDTESVVLLNEDSDGSPVPGHCILNTDFGEVIGRRIDETSQKPSKRKNAKTSPKLVKKKKIEASGDHLTNLQKPLLQKILKVQSVEHLEDLWWKACSSCQECFPGKLTRKKKDKISKLFVDIKDAYPYEMFTKIYKIKPEFLKIAIVHVCKVLGFTKSHITECNREPDPKAHSSDEIQVLDVSRPLVPDKTLKNSSHEIKVLDVTRPLVPAKTLKNPSDEIQLLDVTRPLVPVRTLKKLKLLYIQLQEILKFKNETHKLKSLKTIFKHRITDIRHLKENGKNGLAKKLTYCTSKEFLALYQ